MTDQSVSKAEGNETSTGLLQRAVLRQPGAWDNLVSLYGPLVYHWCRSRWRVQPKDAENIGQEVFLRVSQKLGEFRHAGMAGSFRGWLRTIAYHCYVDHVRTLARLARPSGGTDAQKRLEQLPDLAQGEDSSPADENEDKALLWRRAVELIRSEFSERDWLAFQQVVLEDRSPSDVARDLQVSINVIYIARSRILGRLKDEFGGMIEF